jgi:hypothetical protein
MSTYRKLLPVVRPIRDPVSNQVVPCASPERLENMDQSLLAAIASFPDRGRAIKELAGRDDDFRTLCVDFGDAKAALTGWEQSQSAEREKRCIEYRELVTALTAEMEVALDRQGIDRKLP